MANIAIVDKIKSKIDYSKYFDFEYDEFHLVTKNIKKVLVKDVELNTTDDNAEDYFSPDMYDYVILVGADPCKHIGKISSVIKYQGYLVEDKFLPLTNPGMLLFKPEGQNAFNKAVKDINNVINGNIVVTSDLNLFLIEDEDEAVTYLNGVLADVIKGKVEYIGLDTETTALYCRDGYVLGICMAVSEKEGSYISADVISEKVIRIYQAIFDQVSSVVFHNAKFDIQFLKYHFGFEFINWDDTLLLHYCLDERQGTHDLKSLSIKYTDLGEYDRELEEFKRQYCKEHKIKVGDFTYDLIPFQTLGIYGATDPVATLRLFYIFKPKVDGSTKLSNVYYSLLKKGTTFLIAVENNGVPFSIERLNKAQKKVNKIIQEYEEKLYTFDVIKEYEEKYGKVFNANSPAILRVVLFDMLGLSGPGKLTATGALSTDAEVLTELSKQHPVPKIILEIKKAKKIKSTYLDKILLNLDADSRLRTNFNLATTTSGRLSSSGKLNMQTLPRDDKIVKWCIKARPGYSIVSQDLKTAEMYIVAVLSGDPVLQKIFIEGGDYHSQMAVIKFKLPYTWQEVKEHHQDLRQEAKTVSFEILYKLNFREEALEKFDKLRKWLLKQKNYIEKNGFTYSFFGRKRRLPNVFSSNKEVKAHEVRSGVNALVQGPASDVNLYAGIEMQEYIEETNMDALIFGLVHDSILAEVKNEIIPEYCETLAKITQKDRGLSIPGFPIGLDLEIGGDYSFKGED